MSDCTGRDRGAHREKPKTRIALLKCLKPCYKC